MTKQKLPDEKLVYIHCRSIFSDINSQVRKEKAVTKLLESQKASIKVLTKEFNLETIAVVAKGLLEQRIFESIPRAKLKFPELFRIAEKKEAERAASEKKALRAQSKAAHEIVSTSDDEAYPERDHDGKHSRARITVHEKGQGPMDEKPIPADSR